MKRPVLGILCLAASTSIALAIPKPAEQDRSFLARLGERWDSRRLLIEVRDENGLAPEAGSLVCGVVSPGERYPEALTPFAIGRGHWSLAVEPGRSYVYGWLEEGRPFAHATVRIEGNERKTRRTLELPALAEGERLQVLLCDEDGAPLELSGDAVEIDVRSADTGLSLASRTVGPGDGPATFSLGPGRYEAVLLPRSYWPRWCATPLPPPTRFRPAIQPFEIRPAEPEQLAVRLLRGGQVEVFVASPEYADAPHRERPRAELYWYDPVLETRRTLRFSDGWSSVALESTGLSYTLLPPGEHSLEVVAPGFRSETVKVRIGAGLTTRVRVPLSR